MIFEFNVKSVSSSGSSPELLRAEFLSNSCYTASDNEEEDFNDKMYKGLIQYSVIDDCSDK